MQDSGTRCRGARRAAWLVPMIALLCPSMAGAAGNDVEPESRMWLGVGLGAGKVMATSHAPSADRSGFSLAIGGGYRFNSRWAAGLEFGVIAPGSGCDGLGCTSASPDFAPNFVHWFAVGEYRPANTGWRLRAGAGVSSMCYRWYRSRSNALEQFVSALLGGDASTSDSVGCRNLDAFGYSVAVGYQWELPGSRASLGVQLRGEAADHGASDKAGTPAFKHRAVALQVQVGLN